MSLNLSKRPKPLIEEATVLYHGGCRDGFGAAWAVRQYCKKLKVNCHCIGLQHGDPVPDITDKLVFIVDFAFSPTKLLEILQKAKFVTLWDHHKSAQAELSGFSHPNLDMCFDMNQSGAGLTWSKLFPDKALPWFLRYIQDRDLWLWQLPASREVNVYIESFPLDFDLWDEWFRGSEKQHLKNAEISGRTVTQFAKQQVDILIGKAKEVVFQGHKVLAVNSAILVSDIGNEICKNRPFGIIWHQRRDGKYVYSFRSTSEGVDVSLVAQSIGGGGHRNASGATCDLYLL